MENKLMNYNACIYLRVSKDEGNEGESLSIEGQRNIINSFLKEKKEIIVYNERIDDGYSGMNFERPAFKLMLEDIKSGKINCIIVKDFSRFGRNYILAGKYLEEMFPYINLRFISVNDNYDSIYRNDSTDYFLIPFKNLLNDAYSRDISSKTKISLDVKRKKGDYVSPFTVYGYKKSNENKNKIEKDCFPKKVVFNIFREKIKGKSISFIAEYLNSIGVFPPVEYKKDIGLKYESGLKVKPQSKWAYNSVKNILTNSIYCGILEQGKSTTKNYNKKEIIEKDKSEWIIIENNHEGIVSKRIFSLANAGINIKTRILDKNDILYYFSGKLFCSFCKKNMVRRRAFRNEKEYVYYTCKTNKKNGDICSSHRINENELKKIIFRVILNFICSFYESNTFKACENSYGEAIKIEMLKELLSKKEEELLKCTHYKASVVSAYKNGIINVYDFEVLNNFYNEKELKIKMNIKSIEKELENKEENKAFEFSRLLINCFVKKIYVHENKKIEVCLNFHDIF